MNGGSKEIFQDMDLRVFTDYELAKHENNEAIKELWIITSDLKFDAAGSVFEETRCDNIKRGTKYKFFVQNNNYTRSREKEIKKIISNNPNVEFIYWKEDFFLFIPDFDCVLHLYKDKSLNSGFIGLTKNNKRCYVEMSKDLYNAIYNSIKS